jgi:hypothetical protein
MKRLLLLAFLLILWTFPLSSLPSTPVVSEWPLCFSESEFLALEDQVWAETERTVKEAVEAAVAPYKAVVKRQEGTILWLKVGIGVSLGAAVGLGLWAVLK